MTCAGGLIIDMVYSQTFKCHMQVMYALIHLCGLIGTDAYIEQVVLVVDGLGLHLGIASVIGTAA